MYNVTRQAYEEVTDDVTTGMFDIEQLKTQLENTKILIQQIFNISLPSLEYVQELARAINASILPDEQVQGIVANATASYEAARQVLELARNARSALSIFCVLTDGIHS